MGRDGSVLVYEFSLHVLWTFVQNLQFKSPGWNTLMTYVHDADMVAVKIHHAFPHLLTGLEVCVGKGVWQVWGEAKWDHMETSRSWIFRTFSPILMKVCHANQPDKLAQTQTSLEVMGVRIRFLISIGPKSKQIIFKKHQWKVLCYNCIACKLYVNIWLTHEDYRLYNT